MVLTISGHEVALDGVYGWEARPGDRVFGGQLFAAMQRLLDQGGMITTPSG